MRKKTREGKEGDRFKILLKKEEKTRTTKRRANSLGNSKPALSGEFQTGGDISTDSKHGFIVDVDVINDSDEAGVQRAAVDRIEETFGKKPEYMLGDGAFISTEHIVAMEEAGVELLAPVKDSSPQEDSPALREDLHEPVATEQLPQLPMNPQTKKFDKSCFCYDAADDCYYCPNGERLDFQKIENKGDERIIRMYQSSDCSNCSLSSECLNNPPTPRTIQISIHEPLRQKVIDRMSTDAGKQRYNMRSWIAETPFAYIKQTMGIRQFLLKGLLHVKDEFLWACTPCNIGKLTRLMAGVRTPRA